MVLVVGKEACALKAERGWGLGGQQDPGCEKKWVLAGEHVGQQKDFGIASRRVGSSWRV